MENSPIRFLMTAIVQEQDVDLATRALNVLGVPVFHLASTGGFLGRRNATLMVGLPEGKEVGVTLDHYRLPDVRNGGAGLIVAVECVTLSVDRGLG